MLFIDSNKKILMKDFNVNQNLEINDSKLAF